MNKTGGGRFTVSLVLAAWHEHAQPVQESPKCKEPAADGGRRRAISGRGTRGGPPNETSLSDIANQAYGKLTAPLWRGEGSILSTQRSAPTH